MQPHEERMLQEKTDLQTKINKLATFINDETKFYTLAEDDRELLIEQQLHMMAYLKTIKKRIKKLDIIN